MLLLRSCKLAALVLFFAATSALAQDPNDEPATIIVRVPASARLFVEGVQSTQTGPTRKIVTVPLEPGYKYSYSLRVETTQDGEPRSVTRKVHFRAGETTTVDLSNPVEAPKKGEKQPAAGFKLARHEKELLELLNKE